MTYRKKPTEVEAFKYDGDLINTAGKYYVPDWAVTAYNNNILCYRALRYDDKPCELFVDTREGLKHVDIGDYIIQEGTGELSVCKGNIFEKSYELI